MKSLALPLVLALAASLAFAQDSGAPSRTAQSDAGQGIASAERAVEARHEKVLAWNKARADKRAAKRAAKAASTGGSH